MLAVRAYSRALGLEETIGDFSTGKAADFVYLRPPAGSLLESVVRNAGSAEQALASMFTMAGAESVREVRVAGDVVYQSPAGQ